MHVATQLFIWKIKATLSRGNEKESSVVERLPVFFLSKRLPSFCFYLFGAVFFPLSVSGTYVWRERERGKKRERDAQNWY